MSRLATARPFALIVSNNQSGVFSDFYTEQGHNGLSLSGAQDDPPGRITLQCPKIGFDTRKGLDDGKPPSAVIIDDNYAGSVFMIGTQFSYAPKDMQFRLQGKNKMDLYVVASPFYGSTPTFPDKSSSIDVHFLANNGSKAAATDMTAKDYSQISPALNDLQKLGSLDLKINFPWIQTK